MASRSEPVPLSFVPLALRPEPFDGFRDWIEDELRTVRGEPRG